MKVVWAPDALKNYREWEASDPKMAEKIVRLIFDIKRSPFSGIGKPEPLKQDMAGLWSRRINKEHRLVYRISGKRNRDQALEILQCRFHY
jgi:toxin YoeB